MCLANSGLILNDPNKSIHSSNSSLLNEYTIELNFMEAIDTDPKILNASQPICTINNILKIHNVLYMYKLIKL